MKYAIEGTIEAPDERMAAAYFVHFAKQVERLHREERMWSPTPIVLRLGGPTS